MRGTPSGPDMICAVTPALAFMGHVHLAEAPDMNLWFAAIQLILAIYQLIEWSLGHPAVCTGPGQNVALANVDLLAGVNVVPTMHEGNRCGSCNHSS